MVPGVFGDSSGSGVGEGSLRSGVCRPSFVAAAGKLKPPSGPSGYSGGVPKRRAPTSPFGSDFAASPYGKLRPSFGPSRFSGGVPKMWAPTFFGYDDDDYSPPYHPHYHPHHHDSSTPLHHRHHQHPAPAQYLMYYPHQNYQQNFPPGMLYHPPAGYFPQQLHRQPDQYYMPFHHDAEDQYANDEEANNDVEVEVEADNDEGDLQQQKPHRQSAVTGRARPPPQEARSSWFESSASSSSSGDSAGPRWDPEREDEDDSEDERVLKQIKIRKAAIHKNKKKKRICSTSSVSVPKKKTCVSRRCNFIDDEAFETKDNGESEEDGDDFEESTNDGKSHSAIDEEDDEGESEFLAADEDDHELEQHGDINSHNDFDFHANDEVTNRHFPPLFESSDDESVKANSNQEIFPVLFDSSDDESVDSITASSTDAATVQTQTSSMRQAVLPQEAIPVMPPTTLFDCPIIASFPRPSYSKDRIQEFNYNPDNAPCHRDAVITYETMGDDVLLQKEPLESKGIRQLDNFIHL